MPRKPFFPPLTGSQGLWPAAKPGFASLAHSALGDSGSPADGTDARIVDLFSALADGHGLADSITSMGTDLAAAVARADAIPLGNIDAAIAAATAASSSGIAKIGGALSLLSLSPTWTASVGSPPLPPDTSVIDLGSSAGGGGSNVFSEATYTQVVSDGAAAALGGLAAQGLVSGQLAAAAATVLPVIGIAIGLGLILVHFLGHGCGEACIDAAKAEQIYEAAADDVYAVFKLGMITAAQAVAIMVHLFSAGTQHMGTFGTAQANKGALNMQRVISAEIADLPKTPQPKAQPLNLDAARAAYVTGPGWYPDSLQAAAQLADSYLEALSGKKGV